MEEVDSLLQLPHGESPPTVQASKELKDLQKEHKSKKEKKDKSDKGSKKHEHGSSHRHGNGNGNGNGNAIMNGGNGDGGNGHRHGRHGALALTNELGQVPMPPLTRPQDVELAQKMEDVRSKLVKVAEFLQDKRYSRRRLCCIGFGTIIALIIILAAIFGIVIVANNVTEDDDEGDGGGSGVTGAPGGGVTRMPGIVTTQAPDVPGGVPAPNEPPSDRITFRLCGALTKDTHLFRDHRYILDCQVDVNPGVTLTIEAGTTIEAEVAANRTASLPSLHVLAGARIIANGTRQAPITFTSIMPNVEEGTAGLWTGLHILGRAPIVALHSQDSVYFSAGVSYGGEDPDSDSGVLRYVRVWYGGLGGRPSIIFAGVGRGTTLERIESTYSDGDGVLVIGGTANFKYLCVFFARQDSIHYTRGYQGDTQYVFIIVGATGVGIEVQGSVDEQPRTHPRIRSATFLGNYPHNRGSMLQFRNGAGGSMQNSVIQNVEVGLQRDNCASEMHLQGRQSVPVSYPNYLFFSSTNIIYVPSEDGLAFLSSASCAGGIQTALLADPLLAGIPERLEPLPSGALSPVPSPESIAWNAAQEVSEGDTFFETVRYAGAFRADQDMWLRTWTWLDEHAKLLPQVIDGAEYLCGTLKEDKRLLANVTYILTCQLFVRDNATLYMDPGTTVRSERDFAGRSPAVVIERGSRIIADCTKALPCTFTTNVQDQSILPAVGLWGGLIILGYAPLQTDAERSIAGLENGVYGGQVADDYSGILRYIRIWYAGHQLGEGNHVAALTLAGVGSRTIVDHIDLVYSEDDGINLYGGTVNLRHVAVTLPVLHGIKFDHGYAGMLQYAFILLSDSSDDGLGIRDELSSIVMVDAATYRRTFPQIRSVTVVSDPSNPKAMVGINGGAGGELRESILYGSHGLHQTRCEDEEVTQAEPINAPPQYLFIGTRNLFKNPSAEQTPVPVFQDASCLNRSTLSITSFSGMLAQQSSTAGTPDGEAEADPSLSGGVLFQQSSSSFLEPLNDSFFDPRPTANAQGAMDTFIRAGQGFEARPVTGLNFWEDNNYIGAFPSGEGMDGNWMAEWTWLHINDKFVYSGTSQIQTMGTIVWPLLVLLIRHITT